MDDQLWRFLSETAESFGFSLLDACALWQACNGSYEAYYVAADRFDPETFYAAHTL